MSSGEIKYYVRRQGRVEGPCPVSKLQAEIKLKRLSKYHEVSTDAKQWVQANTIDGLFASSNARKQVGGPRTENGVEAKQPEDKQEIWHCVINGKQLGPFSEAGIVDLVGSGGLRLDDLIWRDGFPDWMPLEDVPELAHLFSTSKSTSGSGGMTEATRLVDLPTTLQPAPKLPWVGFGLACFFLFLSCVPFLGILGFISIGMGSYSIYQQNKNGSGKLWVPILTVLLGVLALIVGIISLAVGSYYLLNEGT